MKNITKPRYEAPKAEIIALEHQSVLCASAPGPSTSTNPTGNGLQFGTSNGSW